jgi:dTDP-glucose 4,6-dehydratase
MELINPSYIFVTGGTGFFGRSLLRFLVSQTSRGVAPPNLVVLSRSPSSFLRKHPEFSGLEWLRCHAGDILDPNSLPVGERFTHILHAATDSTLGPELSPRVHFQQIHDGTRNALDLAISSGSKRFLLTSSGAICGPQPQDEESLSEDSVIHLSVNSADNAYGLGKLAAEHLCALYADEFGLETIVARCFAFVGPDLPLDVHFAIGNFVRDALWADEIVVRGDGSPLRTYLDQDDLANWLLTLLEKGRPGEAYNVGSDEVVSIADLAHLVRDLIAPNKPVRILGTDDPSHARNRYVPDIAKARRELGLNVTISLAQSIRRSAEAHFASSVNDKSSW